jgi:hypothetical protein
MRKRGFYILLSALIVGTCARLLFHSQDIARAYDFGTGPFLPNLPFNILGLYTFLSGWLGILVIVFDFIRWLRNRP